MLTEEKKNRDQLIKDSENITKKTKVILAGLKSAEADLEAFQVRVSLHELLKKLIRNCQYLNNSCDKKNIFSS